ncbi:MAG TPA: PGPGW domain-containing protein [Candidatus Limnocylindria bacterium]|nr:PGPGW domain-containing protein [Candidatus Limnocylindria bacterium]
MLRASVRVGRLVAGLVLMVGGALLSLPGIPGPGILLLIGGLALLGREFHWARRANEWLAAQGRRVMGGSDA